MACITRSPAIITASFIICKRAVDLFEFVAGGQWWCSTHRPCWAYHDLGVYLYWKPCRDGWRRHFFKVPSACFRSYVWSKHVRPILTFLIFIFQLFLYQALSRLMSRELIISLVFTFFFAVQIALVEQYPPIAMRLDWQMASLFWITRQTSAKETDHAFIWRTFLSFFSLQSKSKGFLHRSAGVAQSTYSGIRVLSQRH